jgi:hypothetical protein
LILYSGIKGASLAATAKGVLSGNLTLSDTQVIGTPSIGETGGSGSGTGTGVSAAGAVSGSANQNYLTIANFLVGNGYSKAAAAGICGCIAGESGGNPESVGTGGDGLIGWTPPSTGPALTGHASADLDTQMAAILTYNNAQGAGRIRMLNAISNPVAAADFYSENFERPKVKDSDVRANIANSVYASITKAQAPTG